MTSSGEFDSERDEEALAAEYVLGVLSGDERRQVAHRIESEPAFARRVDQWQERLFPLASGYPEVTPPASVKEALDRRLSGGKTRSGAGIGLWRSLSFWRGLAVAALAALVLYVAIPVVHFQVGKDSIARLVASLSASGSAVHYVAVYDSARGEVDLSHLSGQRGADRDFELWAIKGKNPPVSLGVIPEGEVAHLNVDRRLKGDLSLGVVLAISIEPKGGSPLGKPTGPVVAAGKLSAI